MNTKSIPVFLAASPLILTWFATGCAPQQGGDPRPAIESAAAQWPEAFNSGDGAAVAALYTEDGQLLPPGSPTVTGRENIAAFWQAAIDTGTTATTEVIEVHGQGDTATEIGRFTMADADGNTTDQGKYIVLWRNEGGEWRLVRDIWNSDGAPTPESSGNPMIDDALSAAPPGIAATASVMDWEGNVLREGSGDYTCMPTPPQLTGTAPMCMDQPWAIWAKAWNDRTEMSIDRVGVSYMLAGDEGASNIDPYAEGPTADNEWVVEGPHLMIIVPDPALLDGIPTDPESGGPYVMWKGTPYAHIMVPVAD